MIRLHCLFVVTVATWSSNAVKVNMHGALSLGKDVMDSISHYLNRNYIHSRRSMSYDKDQDRISMTVKAAYLCRGLEICEGKFTFVNEYAIVLGNAVETIFEGILTPHLQPESRRSTGEIFENQFKDLLHEFKKLLKSADEKVTDDREAHVWINIIKRMSAKFQESALNFINDRLEGDPKEMKDVKKKLMQKIVLAVIIVESKFEGRLCIDYNLCDKALECTMSLYRFLSHFEQIEEEKVRMFMRYFYESLPDNLFEFLNEETINEFQIILSDMIYSETVPTKDILLSVLKTVEARLSIVKNHTGLKKAYDVLLVYIILSDMDHFYYSRHRMYNFDDFLAHFSEWLSAGGRFHSQISQVMKDIKKRISEQSPEMVLKLINEAKVFLELTVDPEK